MISAFNIVPICSNAYLSYVDKRKFMVALIVCTCMIQLYRLVCGCIAHHIQEYCLRISGYEYQGSLTDTTMETRHTISKTNQV